MIKKKRIQFTIIDENGNEEVIFDNFDDYIIDENGVSLREKINKINSDISTHSHRKINPYVLKCINVNDDSDIGWNSQDLHCSYDGQLELEVGSLIFIEYDKDHKWFNTIDGSSLYVNGSRIGGFDNTIHSAFSQCPCVDNGAKITPMYIVSSYNKEANYAYLELLNPTYFDQWNQNIIIGGNAAEGFNSSFMYESVAIGQSALATLTNDYASMGLTAIGSGSLSNLGRNTGEAGAVSYDTAIGNNAGSSLKQMSLEALSGISNYTCNTFIGAKSSEKLEYGYNNVSVGMNSGISTSKSYHDCTFIGFNSRISAITDNDLQNSTAIGSGSICTGSNQLQLGNDKVSVYASSAFNQRSDERDKADIRDTVLGLDFLMKHRPVEFRWDYRQDYEEFIPSYERVIDSVTGKEKIELKFIHKIYEKDGSKKRERFHEGFIAQEVKEIMDLLGVDFAGYQDHTVNGGSDVLTLGYTEYIPIIVKAIQELKASYDEKILELESKINNI